MNKKILGLFFSTFLIGCTAVPNESLESKQPETNKQETKSVETVTKNKKKEMSGADQSQNLSIKGDNVFYLNKINDGAIPLMETPVTLIFIEEDGLKNVAKGFSGCNDYYFKYKISSNVLVLGEVVTTNFKCTKQEAKFENFLFRELNRNPDITISQEYVVIKGYKNKLLWEKERKKIDPKKARKVISSTKKNNEINNEDVVIIEEDINVETNQIESSEKVMTTKVVTPSKSYSKHKKQVTPKYVNVHRGVNVTNENIQNLERYKRDVSLNENKLVRADILKVKNRLGGDSKIMNLNLESGETLPLVEYTVKRKDTLKKIILTTYPEGYNPSWLELIDRLQIIGDLNTRIKDIDHIYPYQRIYIPAFKN